MPAPRVVWWCAAAWLLVASAGVGVAARQASQEAVGRPVVSVRFEIEGRPDASSELAALSDVKVGRPFRTEDLRATIEHLARLERYEDESISPTATITPEGVDLLFRLVPRHPITRLRVVDTAGVVSSDLQDRLRQRFLGVPTDVPPSRVAGVAAQMLQDDGYLNASVRTETELVHDPESATLVLRVDRGELALIKATTIVITGVPAISKDEVSHRTLTAPGQPYKRRDIEVALTEIEDDLRSKGLYEAQATATRTPVPGGVELAVNVNTGPRVRLVVQPNENVLAGGSVDELIPIKRLGSADRDLLEDSRARIESRLRAAGYWKAAAPFTRELQENDTLLVVTFTVTTGPRYYVDHVELPALSLPAAALRRLIDVTPGEVFNSDHFFAGMARVRDEYVRNGYHYFDSEPEYEELPARATPSKAWVVLHPTITEGPQVTMTAVTFDFAGEHRVTDAELRSIPQSRAGAPYIQQQAVEDQAALRTFYNNRGFLKADVAFDAAPSGDGNGRVALTFRINEGPQSIISEISVVGNDHVSTASIIEEMGLKIGDPAGAQRLADARSRLGQMGVFQKARVESDGETEAHVIANISELPDRTVAIGGGLEGGRSTRTAADGGNEDYLEFSPRGSFEIGRRNLGGRNRSVNLFSRVALKPTQAPGDPTRDGRGFGFTEYRVTGTYRERRAFRSETDIVIGLTAEQAKRTNFNFIRHGASAEALRRLSPTVSVAGRYALDFTRLLDERIPENEQPLIDRLFPQVRLSLISTGVAWDRRNDPLTPTRGTFLASDVEFAARILGSEVGYVKVFVQGKQFYPIGSRTVLALRGELGIARGVSRTVIQLDPNGEPVLDPAGNPITAKVQDLPASQRFYAGGGASVRGFQLDRLGVPEILTEDGLSIGGNGLVVANAEVRHLVGRLLGKPLTGVGFLDAGNVFARPSQVTLGRIRGAAGFGVRYETPFGSIRFDLGFKFSRQPINGRPGGELERRGDVPSQHRGGLLMTARLSHVAMFVCGVLAGSGALSAQVQMDRVLSRVNGKIVTESDVRQAQLLKLVDDVGSVAATQRALENRLLLLGELSRVTSLPPATAGELEARRREWEASLGGGANAARLLSQAGMTGPDLDNWLRDDLRIQAYLKRQYGSIPDQDRSRAVADSLSRLRGRAGLD